MSIAVFLYIGITIMVSTIPHPKLAHQLDREVSPEQYPITTRSPAALQFEASSPYQQRRQPRLNPANNDGNKHNNNGNVRAPFATAATAMAMMPELRLSSPHPGGVSANQGKSTLGASSSSTSNRRQGWDGRRLAGATSAANSAAVSADSEELGSFEYHA